MAVSTIGDSILGAQMYLVTPGAGVLASGPGALLYCATAGTVTVEDSVGNAIGPITVPANHVFPIKVHKVTAATSTVYAIY